jgi:predicted transcriptional regulator
MATWLDNGGDGSTALEDIEFLARSPHRAEVLGALADAPRTRHELRERADVSRVTISRLLDDLDERNWVDHDNGQYEATPRGRMVAREFRRLHANLTVGDRLDDALEWLPTEEFDFDLACLHDADVLRATDWEGQTEAIRHAADLVEATEEIRGTAIGFSHEVVDEIRDMVIDRGGIFEVVVDETAFRMIQNDAGLRERFHDLLGSDGAHLYRYHGEAPLHMVMSMDDITVICGHIDEGPPPGTLESRHERVRTWARTYFESALRESELVDPDALAPEHQEPT